MDSFAKDTLAWYKARLSDRLGYLKYASERKIMADRMARHSGGKHLDDTKYPGLGRGRVNYGKSDPRKKKGEERLVAMIRSYGRSKVTPHSSPTSNPQEGCIRTISSRSSSSWQGVAAFLERIL